jgi:hypothetical protein
MNMHIPYPATRYQAFIPDGQGGWPVFLECHSIESDLWCIQAENGDCFARNNIWEVRDQSDRFNQVSCYPLQEAVEILQNKLGARPPRWNDALLGSRVDGDRAGLGQAP